MGTARQHEHRVAREIREAEERIVDPETGGAKGAKLPELGALDPRALLEVAKVAGFGSKKYGRYNYAKGYKWSLNYDALCRHILAFWSGETYDPESGLPHMAHAAWHCLALITNSTDHPEKDDRFPVPDPRQPPEPEEALVVDNVDAKPTFSEDPALVCPDIEGNDIHIEDVDHWNDVVRRNPRLDFKRRLVIYDSERSFRQRRMEERLDMP